MHKITAKGRVLRGSSPSARDLEDQLRIVFDICVAAPIEDVLVNLIEARKQDDCGSFATLTGSEHTKSASALHDFDETGRGRRSPVLASPPDPKGVPDVLRTCEFQQDRATIEYLISVSERGKTKRRQHRVSR